jgi:glycogen phosphorylase
VREYTEKAYLPAARQYHHRSAGRGALAKSLQSWHTSMTHAWESVRFGQCRINRENGMVRFEVEVAVGTLTAADVRVELFREDPATGRPDPISMQLIRPAAHAHDVSVYTAEVPGDRPPSHYTPRVMAAHPEAMTPIEVPFVRWQK